MSKFYISVDVGGTNVKYAVFNEEKQIIHKQSHPTDINLEPIPFFDYIINQINLMRQKLGIKREDLKGIGMGLPSFIKFDEGIIMMTSNIPLLNNFPAREYLSNKLNTTVVIDNDGNVAAVAEHRHGAGKGRKHMLYCPVSTGISSAIIINGSPFRGSYGWAGESGHTIITPNDGVTCGCQNDGCFMSHISGSMIIKRVRSRINEGYESVLSDMLDGRLENLTANHILEGYNKGDSVCEWALEHMSRYMGIWLFNIYQILNINTFVFGGGLVNFGDPLFKKAIEVFDELNHIKLPVEFRFAELKQDFGVIGALELLLDELGRDKE